MKHGQRFLLGMLLAGGATVLAAERQSAAIRIRGSNTFGEELGPRLIEVYQRKNPDARVELGTEGTGAGMLALLNGEADIASASRLANEDETRLARAKKLRLRSHFLGYYGVAVIVQSGNPLRSLTPAQVRDIFTGKVTDWKQVGGPAGPIRLFIRDPVSGTHLGFRELAMENRPYAPNAGQKTSYAAIAEAVAADPLAIGYTGMSLAPGRGLRALKINGVPANAASVNEGMYPYARGLRLYTLSGPVPRPVGAFIRFVRGREGQSILEENGFVPRRLQLMDLGS